MLVQSLRPDKGLRHNEHGVESPLSGDWLPTAGTTAFQTLASEMPLRGMKLDRGRPLRRPGDNRNEIILVRSGILSSYKCDSRGRSRTVALRYPGEFLISDAANAGFGVQAIIPSEILVGAGEALPQLIRRRPHFGYLLWLQAQRDTAVACTWLASRYGRDATASVAHLLCETAVRMGIDVFSQAMINPFTQEQIGDMTGLTSVHVNRVLAKLQELGLIRRRYREIFFADWREICRVADFDSGYLDWRPGFPAQ